MAARPVGRTDRRGRAPGRRRIPPGRAAPGEHAAVELARLRRDQRPRTRSGRLHARPARGGRGGGLRPPGPRRALHPHLPAGAAGRGAGRHARPPRGLSEGAGDPMSEVITRPAAVATLRKPRIGFLGVGWIGRHRMEAMLATGAVEAAAIADPSPEAAAAAAELAPGAALADGLE